MVDLSCLFWGSWHVLLQQEKWGCGGDPSEAGSAQTALRENSLESNGMDAA